MRRVDTERPRIFSTGEDFTARNGPVNLLHQGMVQALNFLHGCHCVYVIILAGWDRIPSVSEILKILSHRPDAERIAHAAHLIRAGQVIATPTDTLYGLAADPFNLSAVDSIFRIKGRPGHKPVLLMVNSIEQAEDLAVDLPPSFYKLARKFWPGPLTMVVRASRRMPRKIASET